MFKKIGLLVVIIFLFSCNTKKGSATVDYGKVLNHSQMTDVLVDVYLIEATMLNMVQEPNNLKQYKKHYYTYLYKKHQINHQQFLKSMEYYCFHTKELSQIYIDVINHLTAMQTPQTEQ
jgi:hypothetical protein